MKSWLITLLVAVLVGAAAFFVGMEFGGNKEPTPQEALKVLQNMTPEQLASLRGSGQNGNGPGSFFGGQNRQGTGRQGGVLAGEITAKDAQSITVKLQDGSTKIVLYSGTTTIGKQAEGTAADLKIGGNIFINGTSNSDGSVTAQTIQLRPAGTPAFGPGAGPGPGDTAPGTPGGTTPPTT